MAHVELCIETRIDKEAKLAISTLRCDWLNIEIGRCNSRMYEKPEIRQAWDEFTKKASYAAFQWAAEQHDIELGKMRDVTGEKN